AEALARTPARRCVTLNLHPGGGETNGFGPQDYLRVLAAHARGMRFDVVLAERGQIEDEALLREAASWVGAELVLEELGVCTGAPRHDVGKLTSAYASIMR